MPPSTRAYLSTAAVAERFDVEQEQVLTWIRAGHLAAVDVGAPGNKRPTYRVAVASIEAFERSRRVPVAMPGREVRTRLRKRLVGIREYF
jgi:hypothetical protein